MSFFWGSPTCVIIVIWLLTLATFTQLFMHNIKCYIGIITPVMFVIALALVFTISRFLNGQLSYIG